MAQHVVIDGNNLLHAFPLYAPAPAVGRETLVRLVEGWALRCRRSVEKVTLVFDGPQPHTGLARQMASDRLDVKFSAPATADDLIVELIKNTTRPDLLRVVTSDSAILHEARRRRCPCTDSAAFSRELFAAQSAAPSKDKAPPERPPSVPHCDVDEWLDTFGMGNDDGSGDQPDWQVL